MLKSQVSEDGRTQLPREVRRALGLHANEAVEYEVRGTSVVMRASRERETPCPVDPPAASGVDQALLDLAGSLKSDQPPGTREQERSAATAHVVHRHTTHES